MKLALIGYGKMGKAIEEVALQRGHEIVLTIDEPNLHDFTKENMAKADVAIEFTGPHSAFDNVRTCLEFNVPVVCGSTGWIDKLDEMKKKCAEVNGAFIYSSNFSVGVNIFFEINKRLATLMAPHKEYEVLLEETHHTQKKDAPSGTAITLAEQILEQVHRKKQWVNEFSENTEDLEIISQRIDPAAGTHSVKY
ncbi:MAG TPA: dihydrodipicolinate reductase C-terminal domain-containing protein, partial [Chitinophagaceae bacterium]|nr:dihydrodipicolinate reductase C-terminal domain-containing protein [Chitinophagaceae bacterium]